VTVALAPDQALALAGEVHIRYNPVPAAERVAHYRALIRTRLFWLAIAVGCCAAFWLFYARSFGLSKGHIAALWASGCGFSVVWLAMALVGYLRSRRVLARMGQGLAVRIGRWGVDLHGVALGWQDIAQVAARRHRLAAAGPDLVVRTTRGETYKLPWLFLDTLPGTVDAAVQAYTSGVHRLDISKLDH
jgi:hypothetical protein